MNDSLIDMFNNLHKEVIKNPASTFYARIEGNSIKDDDIEDGDIVNCNEIFNFVYILKILFRHYIKNQILCTPTITYSIYITI